MEGKTMPRFESSYKPPMVKLFLSACLLAGGGMKRVFAAVDSGASAAPGTLVGESTEPTVILSSPRNWATNVPPSINTRDNVVTGTGVTATFSQPMDPATVNSLTFTVRETTGSGVAGTVAMNAAHTEATFTPASSALNPNTNHTATITTAARN